MCTVCCVYTLNFRPLFCLVDSASIICTVHWCQCIYAWQTQPVGVLKRRGRARRHKSLFRGTKKHRRCLRGGAAVATGAANQSIVCLCCTSQLCDVSTVIFSCLIDVILLTVPDVHVSTSPYFDVAGQRIKASYCVSRNVVLLRQSFMGAAGEHTKQFLCRCRACSASMIFVVTSHIMAYRSIINQGQSVLVRDIILFVFCQRAKLILIIGELPCRHFHRIVALQKYSVPTISSSRVM